MHSPACSLRVVLLQGILVVKYFSVEMDYLQRVQI